MLAIGTAVLPSAGRAKSISSGYKERMLDQTILSHRENVRGARLMEVPGNPYLSINA